MDINLSKIQAGQTGEAASQLIYDNDAAVRDGVSQVDYRTVKNENDINSFTTFSKNLFYPKDPNIVRGKYIAGDGDNSGSLLNNVNYSVTGYIPIKTSQTLICNRVIQSSAIGHNLYDLSGNRLTTVNTTNYVTASQDGYVRFTLAVPAATNIETAQVQVEVGNVSTDYVPYSPTINGKSITNNSITTNKLDKKGQDVMDAFTEMSVYDSLTPLVVASSKYGRGANDISGWGATYNKTGNTFNAIRLPAGSQMGSGIPDNRKWKYAQICIKNAQTDTTFIAKSPLINIEGISTLPEIVFPLMTPDLMENISLNDDSFTGSTYWINIYYFNADMSYAYGGIVYGTMDNYVEGSSRYTTTNSVTGWSVFSGTPAIIFEHVYAENIRVIQHLTELDGIQAQIDTLFTDGIEVVLPDNITAVVGDTLQLFFRGIVKAVNPYVYDIVVNCTKGRLYPRYFEYTPTTADIGTVSFEIKIKNSSGKLISSKTCNLITKAAVKSPTALKKTLFIGDSLTNARIYPVEAYRRLTGTGGTPEGLGYNNIEFVGRKKAGAIGVEGNSGWSWVDFVTRGRKAYLFTMIRPDVQPSIESVYKDENGNTYTCFWLYSPTSVKMLVNDGISIPPTAGTLTKVSGGGADTIVYTSCAERSGNPFWSDILGGLSFKTYVDRFCGGSIDVVYVLLSWNGVTGNMTDFSVFINYARTLFNHIKSQYPSIKIKLLGVQLPDQRQGMGLLGAPAENTYTDQYGLTVTALNMNDAYQSFANEPEMSSFVEFVNVASQVDSEYNMPYVEKAVNIRNSTTEPVGTNDVHPDESGYKQIADVVFRNFVANFCQ